MNTTASTTTPAALPPVRSEPLLAAIRAAGRVTGMAQGALGQVRGQFAGTSGV